MNSGLKVCIDARRAVNIDDYHVLKIQYFDSKSICRLM